MKVIDLSKPMNGTIKSFSKYKVLILWANGDEQVTNIGKLQQGDNCFYASHKP